MTVFRNPAGSYRICITIGSEEQERRDAARAVERARRNPPPEMMSCSPFTENWKRGILAQKPGLCRLREMHARLSDDCIRETPAGRELRAFVVKMIDDQIERELGDVAQAKRLLQRIGAR